MQIFSIQAGEFKADGGAVFGVVPKVLWQKLIKPDSENLIPLKTRSLLIITEQRKILIDTGISTIPGEKYAKINKINSKSNLLQSLSQLNIKPQDITDIIHTHLHHDHCGNTAYLDQEQNVKLIFPNAKIWVSEPHWDSVLSPNPREKNAFLPIYIEAIKRSGKLQLISEPTELFPNVFVDFLYGHTKGMMIVKIKLKNRWLVFASDFLPTSHHVYEPYIMSYDLCAEKTMQEKLEFYQWALANEVCIFFQHDPEYECGIIGRFEKGHKIAQTMTLEQWL